MHLLSLIVRRALALAALGAVLASGACETYDPPPEPRIDGATNGILPDATAPLVLRFSEPIDPRSANVKVVVFANDMDEDDDPIPPALVLMSADANGANGATAKISDDGTALTITFDKAPPSGPRLAVVVEPGLSDLSGHRTNARRVLQFGYAFSKTKASPTTFPSGSYFILLDLQVPIAAQLRVWGDIGVNAEAGTFHGQFTHAWRDRNPARCPGLSCNPKVNACTVFPAPACVTPSTNADTVDQYPDWIVDHDSVGTFSVTVDGSVDDRADGSYGFGMLPVDVSTKSPNVTVKAILVTAEFRRDPDGILRGTGSASADDVLFIGMDEGHGSGLFRAELVPADKAPTDIPLPP